MAGTIIERRDHVLMTFLVPLLFCTSTFLIRWSSTNGPFFRLRGIVSCSYHFPSGATWRGFRRHRLLFLPLLLAAPSGDQLVARLVRPSGAALRLAPRANRVPAAGGLAFAAAHRVVDRIHGDAAHARPTTLPAAPAGLAELDVALLSVTDLADGGPAG